MDEEHEMYEMQFPAPDVGPKNGGLTMVVALQGYADAGLAVAGSAGHLLDALEHRPLVNFNNDELVDYRSRRPAVTMIGDQVAEAADLELSLQVVRDNAGKPFLLLSGPEPDLRWDAFSQAVADLVERFDVKRTVSLYSAPMTVPHTRPMGIMAHGNDRGLLAGHRTWGQRVTVPGAASLRIELELNRRGRATCGFTAQVPHYVAASDYPLAALRLLEAVADAGDLDFPLTALERESEKIAELLAEQANESEEVAGVVRMLEQQHDEEERRRSTLESNPLVRDDGTMPSADELGAELERFLATQLNAPQDGERDDVDRGDADSGATSDSSSDDADDTDGHSDGSGGSDDSDGSGNGGPRRPWFRF
ncbi:PAC2 family protein [uncultured Corynebacterium sp.]|uniref:PAC2 family protein n=1 Tax=uncultured Corynebacterium sp. TaxID=159447 RepID=UPI0025D5EB29|nr:PAC2 family protein [uncultured Corynebacterium sp.]